MKLAEALILRTSLNKKISDISNRLYSNSQVQEGEKPAEDPNELLKELDTCIDNLTNLIQKINLTNCTIKFNDKETITDTLARRDTLMIKINALTNLVNRASVTVNRHSLTEIKVMTVINIKELRKEIDDLSAEHRMIDTKIQELNWLTDIL